MHQSFGGTDQKLYVGVRFILKNSDLLKSFHFHLLMERLVLE